MFKNVVCIICSSPNYFQYKYWICLLLPFSSYVIVVEHDLSVLDYLSDFICCLYGKPGAYGVVTLPFSVREGINIFLSGFVPTENLRFRDDSLTFKVYYASCIPFISCADSKPFWGKWKDLVLEFSGDGFNRQKINDWRTENILYVGVHWIYSAKIISCSVLSFILLEAHIFCTLKRNIFLNIINQCLFFHYCIF